MEQLIRFLPIIFRLINMAPQIQQAIWVGTPTVKAVEDNARDLLPLLGQIGKQMFPEDIADSLAPAAAATTMFDPVRVKWLETRQSAWRLPAPRRGWRVWPQHYGRRPAVSGNAPIGRRRMGWRRHPLGAATGAFEGESPQGSIRQIRCGASQLRAPCM